MRSVILYISFVSLCCLAGLVRCARILAVFQMSSYSHQCVFQPYWRELSLRGHQITVLTAHPLRDPTLVNLTEIDLSIDYKNILKIHDPRLMVGLDIPIQKRIQNIFNLNYVAAEVVFNNKEFIQIYNDSKQSFDLIIAQAYMSPIFYSLSAKFQAPIIGINSMGAYIGTYFAMGSPHPPALYTEMYMDAHGKLTFAERFHSTFYYLWAKYYHNYVALPKCDKIARKYLGNDLPYLGEIEKNLSLLFLTTNYFMYPPRPTGPNIINLELMHVKPPKPLPEDLKLALDEAKEGAIYISLGSNVQSATLSPNLKKIIIETISELPYKVLWKWESDEFPNRPKNVVTAKWLPQQDILAHPNIKVFVTQGGLQSIEEAVTRGVPMVAIPFISEQGQNTKRMRELEMAIVLDSATLTKEDFKNAIIEVDKNNKYRKNIEKMREIWGDHPQKSLERAVWWTEYVIRHKGARHLRSPYLDVPWYEYLLLDVIIVTLLGLVVSVYAVYALTKVLFKNFFKKVSKEKRN